MPASADTPGKNWISPRQVGAMLAKRGAKVIKIEADDGQREGKAMRRGVRYEFHPDPRTGRVTKWERDH